jgi:hypothetical protein
VLIGECVESKGRVKRMSSGSEAEPSIRELEVLSSNVVILPAGLSPISADTLESLKTSRLIKMLGRGAKITQGVVADIERGTVTTIVVDGTQSRKLVTMSPLRIDVTDRSGSTDIEADQLLDITEELISFTGVKEIRALGVNFEAVLDTPHGETAGSFVARKFIVPSVTKLSTASQVSSLGVRLYFAAPNTHSSTLAIEPRFSDPAASELSITLNTNSDQSHVPDKVELLALYREGRELLKAFVDFVGLP